MRVTLFTITCVIRVKVSWEGRGFGLITKQKSTKGVFA